MNLDQRNWSELTEADRLRMIELEGYFVFPDLLDPDHVTQIKDRDGSAGNTGRGLQHSSANPE
jgi:hypothetical protein